MPSSQHPPAAAQFRSGRCPYFPFSANKEYPQHKRVNQAFVPVHQTDASRTKGHTAARKIATWKSEKYGGHQHNSSAVSRSQRETVILHLQQKVGQLPAIITKAGNHHQQKRWMLLKSHQKGIPTASSASTLTSTSRNGLQQHHSSVVHTDDQVLQSSSELPHSGIRSTGG